MTKQDKTEDECELKLRTVFSYFTGRRICSKCESEVTVEDTPYRFCPYCGRRNTHKEVIK